jgi:DUF438 domain-containing protein
MSELIQNKQIEESEAYLFCRRLIDGENGKMLFEEYRDTLAGVSPFDAMMVFDQLLTNGYSHSTVKKNVGKIINAFTKSLESQPVEPLSENHFLSWLMLENREVEKVTAIARPAIKSLFKEGKDDNSEEIGQIKNLIERLKEYDLHYVKKENILFPYLEKVFTQHKCLQLMWSFHDDFRRGLKTIEDLLSRAELDKDALNRELGQLFFVIFPIIFREEKIVFPVALRAIPPKLWDEMLRQSAEIGWCYGVNPSVDANAHITAGSLDGLVDLDTGLLSAEQIVLMLNHLPIDITYVDEKDEVRYFSGTPHRIFPRSKAIIGRTVQNCHPHDSVHIVNEIIDAFRSGKRDHADFWLTMRGRFIYIRYFALRDKSGVYRGTIEVSQDLTEARALEGQQRLLSWSDNKQGE